MPLFSSSTPFDGDVEKATSEMNTTEDWGVIMDICDKVGRTPNGAKDCLKSIVKRLNHKIPHVAMQACTMLDASINNCGRAFHLEISSRDFVSELRTLIGGKAHPKVASQLKQMVKNWAENDFKSDPALDMIPTLYNSLLKEGVEFTSSEAPKASSSVPKDPTVISSQQEEDDIAKAIALSLEEEKKKGGGSTKSSSLYPSFSTPSTSSASAKKELRKVRALYDFEAAEDNELTFKAGEVISIIDDSDANWWKGSTWRGEGLFPANFCTADLSVEIEPETVKEKKSVQFNEEVEVKEVESALESVGIDEDRIDKCLGMLQNADPTGETEPDSPEMLNLEEQCKSMGPLIDMELENIDRKHNDLMDLNGKVIDALQMYHNLMKQLPAYGYGGLPQASKVVPPPQQYPGMPQQVYNGQQLPAMMPSQYAPGMVPQMMPQQPGAGVAPPPPSEAASMVPPMPAQGQHPSQNFSPPPASSAAQYTGVATNGAGAAPPVFSAAPPATSIMYSVPTASDPAMSSMPPQYSHHDPNVAAHSYPGQFPPQQLGQQPIYSQASLPPQQQPLL